MKHRKPTSKRLRFEVFARDGFKCQYCGRTPPAVVLEADHVVPVSAGGRDEEDNLITACFDCNRGKAAGEAHRPLRPSVSERAADLAEAEEQLAAYRQLLQARDTRADAEVTEVCDFFIGLTEGRWHLSLDGRRSVRQWLREWPVEDLKEALRIAAERGKIEEWWCLKYIGGILRTWRTSGRPGRGV